MIQYGKSGMAFVHRAIPRPMVVENPIVMMSYFVFCTYILCHWEFRQKDKKVVS